MPRPTLNVPLHYCRGSEEGWGRLAGASMNLSFLCNASSVLQPRASARGYFYNRAGKFFLSPGVTLTGDTLAAPEQDEHSIIQAAQAHPARFLDLYDRHFHRVW